MGTVNRLGLQQSEFPSNPEKLFVNAIYGTTVVINHHDIPPVKINA